MGTWKIAWRRGEIVILPSPMILNLNISCRIALYYMEGLVQDPSELTSQKQAFDVPQLPANHIK
jgi:hypothetical protein